MAYNSPFCKPPRILLMDEDESLRQIALVVLFWSGYEVSEASGIEEAWEALNAEKYDLVIADNTMPDLSGFEVLRKMRSAHMELPVILATGSQAGNAVSKYPHLPPSATLSKPYSEEALLETVGDVLYFANLAPWQRETEAPARPPVESIR